MAAQGFGGFWCLLCFGTLALARGDDPLPKESEAATLVDAAGKELKLSGVKFTSGVRRLAFLADPKGTTEDTRKGPLALEVREPNSTTFQKGVVTLVPLSSVESVKYDYEKSAMRVAIKDQPELSGSLQYQGINVIRLDSAAGKFTGGAPKGGFKSIAFPGAKVLSPRPPGPAWSVQIVQPTAKNPSLTVRNLKALYSFPGGAELLQDALPVRKGEPLRLDAKLKRLEFVAVDPNTQMAALEVLVEGGTERLIAVPLKWERDKYTGTLIGLVGEVDCGWKLFPLHAIKVVKPGP